MATYIVEVEIDGEDVKVAVTNAPSADQAGRAAYQYAEMMGWDPAAIAGTPNEVATFPVQMPSTRYAG